MKKPLLYFLAIFSALLLITLARFIIGGIDTEEPDMSDLALP